MNLRTKFERFCYRNRHRGIPNLMLYIAIGSAIVYILSPQGGNTMLFELLRFDKAAILRGQVWRLFTYVFAYTPGDGFLTLLFLYFFYSLGRQVELSMGTFRFNLYYFSGILIMDIFAMIFAPISNVIIGNALYLAEDINYAIYSNMAYYMHLSLLLSFATFHPDASFLILFIIPVKAWLFGIIYLALMLMDILRFPLELFPHNIFPLVGMLNYLLFAGKDILNLFPFINRRPRRTYTPPKRTGPTPFKPKSEAPAYTHKCCVCGKTDISHPELEFRYCSRCNGYFCYCEEHINNHNHIE